MKEQRSWRDSSNGLIHAVIVEPYRCQSPFCVALHVSGDLLTECGISLELVHDEQPTCIACVMAQALDALGEQLGQPVEAIA